MKAFLGASVLLGFVSLTVPTMAQTHPMRGPDTAVGTIEPDQPVRPQLPVLVPRIPQQPAQPLHHRLQRHDACGQHYGHRQFQ